MTKYYVVDEVSLDDEPRLLSKNYLGDPRGWESQNWSSISDSFDFGLPVNEPVGEIVCELSKLKGVLDIWLLDDFISQRALDVVKGLGETHFQDWPVTLKTRSGATDKETIRFLNVLDRIDCLDRKKSEVIVDENGCVKRGSLLILDETKVPGDRHLFRLKGSAVYLASQKLVEAWQAIGVRGAKFIQPEEYRIS